MIILSTRQVLLLFLGVLTLYGCEGLLVTDTQSLLAPTFARSEICLLYTSPSPRDGLLSRMPSSA